MAVTAEEVWPAQRLRESYVRHGVRTQLYRLFADGASDAHRRDLLDAADDDSWNLARSGHVACLENCKIDIRPDGRIDFASADGTLRGMFERSGAFLPQLRRLSRGGDSAGASRGRAVYRARSVVHYFIALVENPARDPAPFREILADRFSLHYTPSPMTDLAALDAWVGGALSSVVASEHDIHAIDVASLGGARSAVDVRMTSQALFPDGSGAISRNTQRWTIVDAGDRFPRIEEILIDRDAVEFFGPAPDHAPRDRPGPA
jgi:hypothetical protein